MHFKTAFELASYVVYRMSRYKITQLLSNNRSTQKLSATLIYVSFLTNFLKIILDPCKTSLLLHALHAVYLFLPVCDVKYSRMSSY